MRMLPFFLLLAGCAGVPYVSFGAYQDIGGSYEGGNVLGEVRAGYDFANPLACDFQHQSSLFYNEPNEATFDMIGCRIEFRKR